MHRPYVRAGADVATTNTCRIDGVPEAQSRGLIDRPSWKEAALLAVQLAREAGGELGREEECAIAFVCPDPSLVPGHASAFETAIVSALRPELAAAPPTRPEGQPSAGPAYRLESDGAWLAIDGYTDSRERGAALDGKALLEAITAAVSAALVDFHQRTGGGSDG